MIIVDNYKNMNYYEILGITDKAKYEEIRKGLP